MDMALKNIFSKIFKNTKEIKYEFKKKYEDDYILIEIFKNNKKCSISNFSQKEYEYLLNTDVFAISKEENYLKLPYENIYQLDEESLNFFGFPQYFYGILKIENDSYFLNKSGLKYNILFIDGENKYRYEKNNIILREKDEKNFLLQKDDYELVKDIIEYNENSIKNTIPLEQYKIVKKIKNLATKKSIILGKEIEKIGEINLINNLQLDFEEKDLNNMEIIPLLKTDSENFQDQKIIDAFKKEFKNKTGLKKNYTIKIDDKEHQIILSNELLEALTVVKENNNLISKKDFLKKENSIFLDERMNTEELEYNYGPRVKGLGFLNYRTNPTQNNVDIDWFSFELPYIDTIDGEQIKLKPNDREYLEKKLEESKKIKDKVLIEFNTEEGKRKLLLSEKDLQNEILKIKNSCKEVIDFKKAKDLKNLLELMEKTNEEYIEYKGFYVKNVTDKEYLKEVIKEKEVEELNKNSEEKLKKKVLLLKDNIDELEHIEKDSAQICKYKYIQPKNLKENIKLLPYQEEGVAIMQNLHKNNNINGVLLSDDMGLGKTLQILTFLSWIKEKNNNLKALIVVPISLIRNWFNESEKESNQGEIQRFFKKETFSVEILKGKLTKEKKERINNSNILLTSYETLRINHIELGKNKWDVMICDEAQKIKNPNTLITTAIKTQNANFKIACSATPIENSILDLWCLVDFSNPGLLGSLKEFKKKYLTKNKDENKLSEINDELKSKLGEHFIRRTKDILNHQGKYFPKKIIIYHHLKYSKKQTELLEQFNKMKLQGNAVLPLIQRMIMVCSHPKLVENKNELNVSNLELINESLKLENTKEILDLVQQKNEKAIIFTKYKKMQKILSIVIKEWYGFNPNIINGEDSSEIRRMLLDNYRESKGFNIIILSPEAAGVGLNIVEANHIIHYTRHWNPAKEEQATDRAYRLGQTKDVFVYYPLISSDETYGKLIFNSVDEWIESEKFNFTNTSSPEEKLNKIIIKKKKLLRDFFLAAPIDMDETDFNEFKDKDIAQEKIINIETLDILDWNFLEAAAIILLEKKYNKKGFLTKKTGDFGVDGLIQLSENDFMAIQVKKSKNKIDKSALEEVLSGKNIYEKELNIKIKKVAVVTNSEVYNSLKERESNNIEIIDRKILSLLLEKYQVTFNELQEKLK